MLKNKKYRPEIYFNVSLNAVSQWTRFVDNVVDDYGNIAEAYIGETHSNKMVCLLSRDNLYYHVIEKIV